jgi:hypothetical protein
MYFSYIQLFLIRLGQFLVSGSQDESLIIWSCEMPSKKFQVIRYAHICIEYVYMYIRKYARRKFDYIQL